MIALSAPKIGQISQSSDPKKAILAAIGDISKVRVCADLVLLGTFIRNEMTAGGIIRPKENVNEDEHQGKVGLVLKAGPMAYAEWEDHENQGENAENGIWVVYYLMDARQFQINGTPCRMIPYDKIRMVIPDPNMVF
jgi:hypothetical protein